MRFDNPPTDRQPHPGALRFGGENASKTWSIFSAGSPTPKIAHREQYLTIVALPDLTVSSPLVSFIASIPFSIRFIRPAASEHDQQQSSEGIHQDPRALKWSVDSRHRAEERSSLE